MADTKQYYWASHQAEGYLPVLIKLTPDGQCIARIPATGEQFTVDKDSLLPADPTSFDPHDNLVSLTEFTEPALLHNLRIRFQQDLIYTWLSSILISVNPFKQIPLYSAHVMAQYRQGLSQHKTLSPHIFVVADNTYKSVVRGVPLVCVCIAGESGSGKSEAMKFTLGYLAEIAASHNSTSATDSLQIADRILSSNPILESFGNAKTARNNNSSRFGKLVKLIFNQKLEIDGAKIESYLLEKSRVVPQGQGPQERSYHIFYQMFAGLSDAQKQKYALTGPFDYQLTAGAIPEDAKGGKAAQKILENYTVDGMDDKEEFYRLVQAFGQVGIPQQDQDAVFQILAGLLHLGNVEFDAKGDTAVVSPTSQPALKKAAELLQIDSNALNTVLVSQKKQMGRDWVTTQKTKVAAEAGVWASIKAIYSQQFDYLIAQINHCLKPKTEKACIAILDIFGFEVFEHGNSFEQLCINFTNEKMQSHFNRHVFKLELDEYKAEQLQIDVADVSYVDNQPCLDMIETGRGSILAICDDVLRQPKASDETLLATLHQTFASNRYYVKPKIQCPEFGVNHYAGRVDYTVTNFLAKNKDQLDLDLAQAFASSTLPLLSTIMRPLAEVTGTVQTLGFKFKTQLNDLMKVLNASEPHFVRCIKSNNKKVGDFFDGHMVLSQVRYLGLRDIVLIRQKGYPLRRPFEDFIQRYKLLLPSIVGPQQQAQTDALLKDPKKNGPALCTTILQHVEPKCIDWKLGQNKVFYRMDVQTKLETARDAALSQVILDLQTHIRRDLERKRFLKRNQILVSLRNAVKSTDLTILDKIIDECEHMSVSATGNTEMSQLYRQCMETRNRLMEQQESLNALKKAINTKDIEMLLVAIIATRNAFAAQCNLKTLAVNIKTLKIKELNQNEIPSSLCPIYAQAVQLVQKLKEFDELTQEVLKTRDLHTAKEVVQMSKQLDLSSAVISRWETFELQIKEEKTTQSLITNTNSRQYYEQFKQLMTLALQQQSVLLLTVLMQKGQQQNLTHDSLYIQGKTLLAKLPQDITAMTLAKELKAALESNDLDIITHAVNIALAKGFGAHDLVKQCQVKQTELTKEQNIKKQLQNALISPKRVIVEAALDEADKLATTNPSIKQCQEYLQAQRVLAEMKEKQKKFNQRASVHARRSIVGGAGPLGPMGGRSAAGRPTGGAIIEEGDEDGDFDPEAISRQISQNGVDIWATASIDELQIALAEAESAGLDDAQVKQLKKKLNQLQQQRQALDLLKDSVESGNIRMLEAAIDRAEKAGMTHQNELFSKAIKMRGLLRDKKAARGMGAGATNNNNRASIFGTNGQSLSSLQDITQIRELNIDTFTTPFADPEWYTSSEFQLQSFPYLRPVGEYLKSKSFSDQDKIQMFKHQAKELPNTLLQLEAFNYRHFFYNAQAIGGENMIELKKLDSILAHSTSMFKSIQAYMFDRKMSFPESLIAELILTCQSYPYFRDEVYMMVMKQLTDNPHIPSLLQGWRLLGVLSRYIAPSPTFYPYVMRFIFSHTPQAQTHHDYDLRIHLNPKMTTEEQTLLRNTARYCLTLLPIAFRDALLIAGDLARRNITHYTFYLPPQGAAIVGSNGQPVSNDKSSSDGIGRYDQDKVREMIAVITQFSTKSMTPVLMHIYWTDGSAIPIIVCPWDSPQEIVDRACKVIGVNDTSGLWLYEQYKYKHYALLPYQNPIDIQHSWLDKSQKKRKLFKQTAQAKQSKFSRFTNFINNSLSSISEPNTVQGRNGLIVNKSGKRRIVIRRRTFFNPIQLSSDYLMNLILFFQAVSDINNSLYHIHADSAAMLAKMSSLLLPKLKALSTYLNIAPPPPEDEDEDGLPPPPPEDDDGLPPPPPPPQMMMDKSNNKKDKKLEATDQKKALLSSGDEVEIDYSLPLEPPQVDLVKTHKPICPPNLLVGKYKITEKKFFQTMDNVQLDLQYLSVEQYVATVMQLPVFASQFFWLEQSFDPLLPKQCILAVNQGGVFVLDSETTTTLEQYTLLNVLGWASGPGRLTLHVKLAKPDRGKTTRALRFETDRNSVGTEVCSLLMAYAKNMLAQSKQATSGQ